MAKVYVADGKITDIVLTGAGYGSGNVWHSRAKLKADGFWRGEVMCLKAAAVGYEGGRDNFEVEAAVLDDLATRLAEQIGEPFMFTFDKSRAGYCYFLTHAGIGEKIGSVKVLLS